MPTFPPTRAAALDRLAAFAPRAGRPYAAERNTDPGPAAAATTAQLSPYLRRRMVLEREVVSAALDAGGPASRKFVEEVFWRTYWKGWLEHRPSMWSHYRAEVVRGHDRLATESGLRRAFHEAIEGATGIECFDAWARELVSDNWLHNHSRMWFASIWIFTLRLPWALGSDFFARHLLCADPAANTLSWRWVAGLHTRGKHYVARAENIARYTDGRFDPVGQLDEHPEPLAENFEAPTVRLAAPEPPPSGDVALLLHDDDLDPETLDLGDARVVAVAGVSAFPGMAHRGVAEPVAAFSDAAVDDALGRAGRRFGVEPLRLGVPDLKRWVADAGGPVVTPYPPTGPTTDALGDLPVTRLRRAWDSAAWPHCEKGFFGLREHIPDVLAEVGLAVR